MISALMIFKDRPKINLQITVVIPAKRSTTPLLQPTALVIKKILTWQGYCFVNQDTKSSRYSFLILSLRIFFRNEVLVDFRFSVLEILFPN